MSVKSTINFGIGRQAVYDGGVAAMPAVLSLIGSTAKSKVGHKSGDLISSEREASEGLHGAVGFGSDGQTAQYTIYQHEGHRQDGSHVIQNRPSGGEGKFLESTINDPAIGQQALDIFAQGIRSKLG